LLVVDLADYTLKRSCFPESIDGIISMNPAALFPDPFSQHPFPLAQKPQPSSSRSLDSQTTAHNFKKMRFTI
jgi:hypothetical protein